MRSHLRRVLSPSVIAVSSCLTLLAAACGGGDGGINAGIETEINPGTEVADQTPATILVAEAYNVQDVPQWDDDRAGPSDQVTDFEVEVLGMAMTGQGELVRLTAPSTEESECIHGWLGFRFEDGEVQRYDDLGTVGHARLFNGPRGQDAIVISCEESTERVLIQGSAVVPDTGVPELTEFALGQPHLFDFGADFGWRGDLFGGYGWHGGWDELVYFDTATGLVTDADVMLGTRLERLGFGFDFVLPNGWELRQDNPGDGAVDMWATDQSAWISILPVEWVGDPEFPEGAEPDDFLAETAGLWEHVSVDRARLIGSQDRLTWTVKTEDGTLTIMHMEDGAVDLIVEAFIDDTLAGSGAIAVVNAAIEQIRSYEAVR